MDKSESELLEEWDLVSSAYDTEQENGTAEKKTDTHTESSASGNIDLSTNGDVENRVEVGVKSSGADSKEITELDSQMPVNHDTQQTVEAVIISEEASEVDSVTKQMFERDIIAKQVTGAENIIEKIAEVDDVEKISEVDITEETKVGDIMEQISAVDVTGETKIDGSMEQISAVDVVAEEITGTSTRTDTEKNIELNNEKTTEIEAEKNTITDTHKVTDEKIDNSNIEKNDAETEKESCIDDEKNKAEAISDHKTDAHIECSSLDNSDDHVVNSSLDSSMEHIQIEHYEGSFVQDVPELISDLAEQENAAVESSSSDIDIIDDVMEESVTSSFLHPLSLSISSSVDTSSILTTPSEVDKEAKTEQRTEGVKVSEKTEYHDENLPSYSESSAKMSESLPDRSESYFRKSRYEDKDENVRPEPQRPHPHNVAYNMFAGILEFLCNMTRFEWSILGGIVLCLYITVVFNQTNIFAVVEKENVASQMKNMINELKHDNKILRDQMLSEMKNEKVFSTFEHQIKELKKENSKLNHMLYDVAKVLEEQKDTQKRFEKRQSEYIAPFKKEINQLKEYINILKFDNEALQKQLVRMRYASYSQGGSDTSDDKTKEQKGETKAADETVSTEEVALDINTLKKWNELISLLSKELGLSETEPLTGDKSHSYAHNFSWYWKTFLQEFKGTFKDFKANVTSVISDYKKANEKAVSEIYKFVKDFFTVKEEEHQKHAPSEEESSQWKNIGDFVKDLSEKWTKIKDRIYTSDIKNFVRNFRKSGETDSSHDDYNSEKTKSTVYDYNERKPTNTHFESDRKHDKVQSNSENSKWLFKRAELRAELRDTETEDPSVNWFLKRKKHSSQDETEEIKY